MENSELDLKAVISALMNDDKIAESVKQLKATLSESSEKDEKPSSDSTDNKGNNGIPDLSTLTKILSISEKGSGDKNSEIEKRNRLLAALKPYLRESRRDMIDKVMSLSNLTGLIDLLPGDNS